jgi:hypothetical protein
MPEVPRQRGAAAIARAGLQPGNLPALYRVARGNGPMVADQPATQTDQDWCPRHPSRPRNYLPTGRGGRHRPDGARHPRRHPPIASATAMRVTAIWAKTQQKRLDRSAHRAEKRRCRARMLRVHSMIRRAPGVRATTDTAQGEKCLFNRQNQAILTTHGSPLGECRKKNLERSSCYAFHFCL